MIPRLIPRHRASSSRKRALPDDLATLVRSLGAPLPELVARAVAAYEASKVAGSVVVDAVAGARAARGDVER